MNNTSKARGISFTIKTKISIGIGILATLFLLTGVFGIYGIQALRDSLQYITSTAWDTADGAMEGSIGIEAEMIGIARTLQRQQASEPVSAMVAEGRATADEALTRMERAGLIDEASVRQIEGLRARFGSNREALLASHTRYLETLQSLEAHFFEFQELMEAVEEVGDGQIEELREQPDRYLSWKDGLATKWTAADGGMESSIGLLKRMYYFQRLVSGKNLEQSKAGLAEAQSFLQEAMDELVTHPIFLTQTYTRDDKSQSFSAWIKQSLAQHYQDFDATIAAYLSYRDAFKAYNNAADDLLTAIEQIEEMGDGAVEGEVDSITALSDRIDLLMLTTLAIGIVIALVAAWKIISSFSRPIAQAVGVAEEIARENLEVGIDTSSQDEIGDLLRAMARMRDNLRESIARDRQLAHESSRIRQALDKTSGNIMVADADNNIIYLNDAAKSMFHQAEADIRRDIPGFDAGKLMGANIDQFHKNPAQQKNLVARLSGQLDSGFTVGGRHMKFAANPVISNEGERLGTVVQWTDQTAEVAIQNEIENLITAARRGDLSGTISLEGKEGFFKDLSTGMNELVSTVSRVVNEIADVMGSMARGDLRKKMTGDYQGSFADVQRDVNSTIDSLLDIVGSIRSTTDQINAGANEIANGNNNLSSRTEQQAASLEETASSMEELTSTVRQNADNAQHANQLADGARSMARDGSEIVSDAIEAMDEINKASTRISEIVSVIDEIAFQTNLLALNASVEAARAGEQGRGFAVVATEVRNLAQRSATSAKEIKELIVDSVRKVEVGSDLVNRSGEALDNIMTSVVKVGDIVAEISSASKEQADGIDQVNMAITNLDSLTQQNAALAEEISAASVAMNDHAASMGQQVEFFQTGAAASNSKPHPTATAAPKASPKPAQKPKSAPVVAQPAAKAKSEPEPARPAPPVVADDDDWEEF